MASNTNTCKVAALKFEEIWRRHKKDHVCSSIHVNGFCERISNASFAISCLK